MAASNERRFSLADFIKSERVKRNENAVEDIKSAAESDPVKSLDDKSLRTVSPTSSTTSGHDETSALYPVRIRRDQTRHRRHSKFYDTSRKSVVQDIVDKELCGVSTEDSEEHQSPSTAPRAYHKRRRFSVIQDNEGDNFTMEDKLRALQEEGGKPSKKKRSSGRSRRASKSTRTLSPLTSSAGSRAWSEMRAALQDAASVHGSESRQGTTTKRTSIERERREMENEENDIDDENTIKVEIRRGKPQKMQRNVIVLQLGETTDKDCDENVTVCKIGKYGPADSDGSVPLESKPSRDSLKPYSTSAPPPRNNRLTDKDDKNEATADKQRNREYQSTMDMAGEDLTQNETNNDPITQNSYKKYTLNEKQNINPQEENRQKREESSIHRGDEELNKVDDSALGSQVREADTVEYKQEENDAANCTIEGGVKALDKVLQRSESNTDKNQLELNAENSNKVDFQAADICGSDDRQQEDPGLKPHVADLLDDISSESKTGCGCDNDKKGQSDYCPPPVEIPFNDCGEIKATEEDHMNLQTSCEGSKLKTQNPDTDCNRDNEKEVETNPDNTSHAESKTQIVESINGGYRERPPGTQTPILQRKSETEEKSALQTHSANCDSTTSDVGDNEIAPEFNTEKSNFKHEHAHEKASVLKLLESNLDIDRKAEGSSEFDTEQSIFNLATISEGLEQKADGQPETEQGVRSKERHPMTPPTASDSVPPQGFTDTPTYPEMGQEDAPVSSTNMSRLNNFKSLAASIKSLLREEQAYSELFVKLLQDTRAQNASLYKSPEPDSFHDDQQTNNKTTSNRSPPGSGLQQNGSPEDKENSNGIHPENSVVNNGNQSFERNTTPAEQELDSQAESSQAIQTKAVKLNEEDAQGTKTEVDHHDEEHAQRIKTEENRTDEERVQRIKHKENRTDEEHAQRVKREEDRTDEKHSKRTKTEENRTDEEHAQRVKPEEDITDKEHSKRIKTQENRTDEEHAQVIKTEEDRTVEQHSKRIKTEEDQTDEKHSERIKTKEDQLGENDAQRIKTETDKINEQDAQRVEDDNGQSNEEQAHFEMNQDHHFTSHNSESNSITDIPASLGSRRTETDHEYDLTNYRSSQSAEANQNDNENPSDYERINDFEIESKNTAINSSSESPACIEGRDNSGIGTLEMSPRLQQTQFGLGNPSSGKKSHRNVPNPQKTSPKKRIEITIKDDEKNRRNDLTLVIEVPQDGTRPRGTTPVREMREQFSQTEEEPGMVTPRVASGVLPPIKCEPPLVQCRERSFVRLHHTPAKEETDPEVLYFIEQAELSRQRTRVENIMKELYQIKHGDLLTPSPCPHYPDHVFTASRDRHPRFFFGDHCDVYESMVLKATRYEDSVRRFLGYTKRTDRLQSTDHSRKYKAYIDLRKKLKHLY